jgi:predicted dehydrogenase
VLGEIKTFSSLLATQISDTPLVNRETNEIVEVFKKTTPDQIMLQATLETGAVLSYHTRADAASPSDPALIWRIFGTKGEIELTTTSRAYLNVGPVDTKITLHERRTGKVEEVKLGDDKFAELPSVARNIARIYEAYKDGTTEAVDDFDAALKRHALIDEMLRRWDSGEQGNPIPTLS